MSKNAWLTADEQPSAWVDLVFRLPANEPWQAQARGALVPLMYASSFEAYGTLTPDEMADTWRGIILQFFNEVPVIPTGTILEFAGDICPDGFLWADGQSVGRTEYPALFFVIGITYGNGDGETTFELPNRAGRVAVGRDGGDSNLDALGETGGAKTHTLLAAEIPANMPYYWNFGGTLTKHAMPATTTAQLVSGNINPGGGGSHNNMPPYLVLNYIIKT